MAAHMHAETVTAEQAPAARKACGAAAWSGKIGCAQQRKRRWERQSMGVSLVRSIEDSTVGSRSTASAKDVPGLPACLKNIPCLLVSIGITCRNSYLVTE